MREGSIHVEALVAEVDQLRIARDTNRPIRMAIGTLMNRWTIGRGRRGGVPQDGVRGGQPVLLNVVRSSREPSREPDDDGETEDDLERFLVSGWLRRRHGVARRLKVRNSPLLVRMCGNPGLVG